MPGRSLTPEILDFYYMGPICMLCEAGFYSTEGYRMNDGMREILITLHALYLKLWFGSCLIFLAYLGLSYKPKAGD